MLAVLRTLSGRSRLESVRFFTLTALIALLLPGAPAFARPKYAAAEGVTCAFCHANPSGGGPRNYRGLYYAMHSRTFAGFDDKAEAMKAGVPVGPEADSKPLSQTSAATSVAGAAAAANLVPAFTAPKAWQFVPRTTLATAVAEGNALRLVIPAQPEKNLQLMHEFAVPPSDGAAYTVSFRARADIPCSVHVFAQRNSSEDKDYVAIGLGRTIDIGTEYQQFTIPWKVSAPHPKRNKLGFGLTALMGRAAAPKQVTLYLSDIMVTAVGGAAIGSLPPPAAPSEPAIAYVDPKTIPDFARWQDPLSRIWFVKIPAGSYRQGTTDAQRDELKKLKMWSAQNADEQPARIVQITRPFLLSATEVTQSEWRRVTQDVPGAKLANPSAFRGTDRPVDSISYRDAQLFCRTLRESGKAYYRLPTEAEWEYAARAGSEGIFPLGAGKTPITPSNLGEYAWMYGTSSNSTGRAGAKKPNAWGLYDMLGNVWEWCMDNYSPTAYSSLPSSNPLFTTPTSTERVLRGGCWFLDTRAVRAASRGGNLPDFRSQYVGMRLVRDL